MCCLCACGRAISKFLAEGWLFRFWLEFVSSFHAFFDALSVLSLGQVLESWWDPFTWGVAGGSMCLHGDSYNLHGGEPQTGRIYMVVSEKAFLALLLVD